VHNYGAYDWAHIKFDIPLADPTRSTPTRRQESLALALARPAFEGGSARANSKVLLRCTEGTPCKASFTALAQKLPVILQTRAKRFSIQGSCSQPGDLKLVPAGNGKAGEVVIVQVTLENRGDTDLEGLSILAPRHNTGPRRNSWPSSNDMKLHEERPGMWGLYTIAGHHQRPHQQGGTFLASTTRLDFHQHLLVIPGTGYAMGLVGIKQPLTLRAGKTENLFVLFLAANADDPKEPVDFDFLAVALALRDQLDAETRRLALQPE